MRLRFIAFLVMLAFPIAAFAQAPAAPPPTDEQLVRQSAAMQAESARYYEMLARRAISELNNYQAAEKRNATNPKETADWWASYNAGLPKEAAQK